MTDAKVSFVRGNERLAKLLTDPQTAREVAEIRVDMRRADDAWHQGLASVQEAIGLALDDVAARLRTSEGPAAAQPSLRPHALLDSLGSHLAAIGGTDARIVVQLNGQNIELALPSLGSRRDAPDPSNLP